MRHRAAAALAAATILLSAGTAGASRRAHHPPRRVDSHVSLHLSRHNLLSGHRVVVRGRVRPGGPHRVKVVLRGRSAAVAGTATNRRGAFQMTLGTSQTGTYSVRAYGVHDRGVSASRSAERHLTVYRQAMASYYGPGLYGHGVACGGTLLPGTLGVAHKTLPCGTEVKLRYHGHSVTVPVIDRGPYVAGRDYDLTEATRERLHFPGLGVVLSSR